MILEYSVTNTFSIKDTQSISFEAVLSNESDSYHIKNIGDKRILKTACIYGANAAGKTNMVTSLMFYLDFILTSFTDLKPDESTHFIPFLFDKKTSTQPGIFSIIFFAPDFSDESNLIKYEYSITLNKNEVLEEVLYYSPKGQKKLIFERKKDIPVKWGSTITGAKKIIADATRPNCSLIGAGAQVNHPVFSSIYKHFSTRVKPMIMPAHDGLSDFILRKIEKDDSFKNKVIGLLEASDFGSISDIIIESHEILDTVLKILPKEVQDEIAKKGEKPTRRDAKFVHHYDNDYELPIYFESAGTKRMLELTLPLIELANSSVLMIDEIESSLHQSLLETFLQLFLEISDDSQLLFTTHNLDLLDSDLLRDDEVWFCFKTDKGNSIYNSITDYKGIRKEASRKKLYMADKFGALPIIDMQKLKGLFNAKKN